MSRLETGIFTALSNAAGVGAIVGNRIRPLAAGHADARPYLTYHVTSDKTTKYMDGSVDDWRNCEFELGCFGNRFDVCSDLCIACTEALDAFNAAVGGIEFGPISYEDQTDVEEVVPEGQELPVYLRVQTYKALYRVVA